MVVPGIRFKIFFKFTEFFIYYLFLTAYEKLSPINFSDTMKEGFL